MDLRASLDAGFRHEAVFYASDKEYLDTVAPFLEQGVASGQPTVAALSTDLAALVRSALPCTVAVDFLPGSFHYNRPVTTLRAYQELFADYLAAGADSIRVVAEVPHASAASAWGDWACYEAACNHAFRDYPLWGLCPYDRRSTSAEAVAEVRRTHPLVRTGDGRSVASASYEHPTRFLAGRPPPAPDPIEQAAPSLVLDQPSPAAARHSIASLSRGSALGESEIEDLLVAVSEIVTNAVLHGQPPVTLRAWCAPRRIVVTVHDVGPGPGNPLVGLVPAQRSDSGGGLGLWISHQLCPRVTLDAGSDGFTVRLVAGSAPPS